MRLVRLVITAENGHDLSEFFEAQCIFFRPSQKLETKVEIEINYVYTLSHGYIRHRSRTPHDPSEGNPRGLAGGQLGAYYVTTA
jgi:hypothetical protein